MSLTIVNGVIQTNANSNNPFVAAGVSTYPFLDINNFITGINNNWFSTSISNTFQQTAS